MKIGLWNICCFRRIANEHTHVICICEDTVVLILRTASGRSLCEFYLKHGLYPGRISETVAVQKTKRQQ